MSSEHLATPYVPKDADLRDFSYMPIEITRLLGSNFNAQSSDAEWRAGVTLWLRSFHQVPAGSLPDDEIALTRLAELGRDVRSWRKIATGALRGWIRCSDGRLYHRTVGEKVLEGWIEKLLQRKSSAAGNAKRHGHVFEPATFDDAIDESRALLNALNPRSRVLAKRFAKALTGSSDQPPTGSADGIASGEPNDVLDQSQGNGSQENIPVSLRSTGTRAALEAFDRVFWPAYPNKVGKPAAAKAFEKLWREFQGDVGPIIDGLQRYIRDKPADRSWLNPATFLNQRRFDDEPATVSRMIPPSHSGHVSPFFEAARQVIANEHHNVALFPLERCHAADSRDRDRSGTSLSGARDEAA